MSPAMRRAAAILLTLPLLAALLATAAGADAAPYGIGVTQNVPITMRDGTVLRADVYYPTVRSGQPATGPFPVIVAETPYGRQAARSGSVGAAVVGYTPHLVSHGYIQAVVDVRGSGNSGGTFVLFGAEETADSVEVIDWAAKLPRSTGRVGMLGESYGGIVQLNAAAAAGPGSPLKAIFPITAAHSIYRELATSGGIPNIETVPAAGALYGALPVLAPPTYAATDPAALATLPGHAKALNEVTRVAIEDYATDGPRVYDGDYWRERAPGNRLAAIVRNRIPAYLVGGLWDIYQEGAPLNYAGLQNAWAGREVFAPMAPRQRATGRYQLLMTPAYHMNTGMAGTDLDPIKLAWFDRWLKNEPNGIDRTRTPLRIIEPGGNQLAFAQYPPRDPQRFSLNEASALTATAPTARRAADTLVYSGATLPCDRATHQWALGGAGVVFDLLGYPDPCTTGVVPQSAGPGQVAFTTAPFPAETVLAGPIAAGLYARTTTADSEWVVEVSDVAPDGTATDLTQGALLGSHRALDERRTWRAPDGSPWLPHHPFTRAAQTAAQPGELVRYDVTIRPAFATIKPGHRLRLTILTSQTPHLLPTPKQQANLIGGVYSLHRNVGAASYVQLPLLPRRS